MRTLTLIALCFGFLLPLSCKHKHTENTDSPQIEAVQLDQGKKWKADQPTNEGVAKLQNIVASFRTESPNPGIEDYKRLNSKLQAELDEIFKKCKMSGEAHHQLHNFLVLVIKDLNSLKEDDLKTSQQAFLSMEKALLSYNNFFE